LVTLCHSRYAFLAITLRQDLPAVLEGLEAAWTFFGGVVKRLVVDNLKPAVTRPDRYTPRIDQRIARAVGARTAPVRAGVDFVRVQYSYSAQPWRASG
jgi:transposase